MKKQLLWLALLLVLVATCKQKDPEPDLPPETATGANTFGCILNGQIWKPSKSESGFQTLWVSPEGGGWLTIKASYRDNTRFETVRFFSTNVFDTGIYKIKKPLTNRAGFDNLKANLIMDSGDADVAEDGELVITTFDMSKRIVAGTFWFRLEKQGHTPIEAKEGRFDISLR
jgi:hypothetical protein